ncbi:LysR family transcriptional regulator [Roseivirga misakiensis]|uniref:LysR family transcriptional regulator n=1 Tax=Roseivirga misakiensis TaxID=1563681 RepID=A0A1E5T0R5_9BACT|nr:LysR family transcriptional regulator [Roseivirga misakiensis]OEK04970.1 LysR family transcriptional regulator [Roseivirga misakiensis]
MELKYFRLIKTIAEEGNIANSSDKLFLTQSALSHQLRELEERLGFKVFHRTRNNWNLTKEGAELHKLANELFERIELGFSSIEQIKEGSKGSIRLSAECQSFFHGLPAFVQKMAVLYPEIEIDLSLDGSQSTVSQLLSNEVDVAIVTSAPVSDALFTKKVLEDEIFVIMHQEHKFSDLEFLDVSHFADLNLIINSFPLESVSVYEHFLKPNKIIPRKVTAIPFTEVSLEMVVANMGVVCLPKWSLKSYKLSDELVFKKIGKNGLKRSHYLVVKEEQRNRKHISAFIDNFLEEFTP